MKEWGQGVLLDSLGGMISGMVFGGGKTAYDAYKSQKDKVISIEKLEENDILKLLEVHRSVGASAKNYPVKMPDSRQRVKFAEGQKVEGVVFAGKGTKTEIKVRFWLEAKYRIKASEWQKVSGNAYVIVKGESRRAEIHWYEAIGEKHEFKVKRFIDES